MPHPQKGIIPAPSSNALSIVFRVCQPAISRKALAKIACGIPSLVEKVGSFAPSAGLVCTVSFGSELWDVLSPGIRPAGLRPFKAIAAEGRTAPSTGGDVLLHILSKRCDLNFELAMRIRDKLGDRVDVMEEVHGFQFLDSRDLSGFIDGTENPRGIKARAEVALIGNEDPTFAGGSYVFTQRYVHDLKNWAAIPIREQEKVIGRRKIDSKELSGRIKPPTAHISRVVIKENGEEMEIVRHSFPYGTLSESGLYFIAYCKTLDIPERMLIRMMGTSGDGLHDRLMDYSRAVSGANFFAPSLERLAALGKR